eukprot:1123485-Rhodomonas_salina.1
MKDAGCGKEKDATASGRPGLKGTFCGYVYNSYNTFRCRTAARIAILNDHLSRCLLTVLIVM